MKKLFLSRNIYLWVILVVGMLSLFLIIPNSLSFKRSEQNREIVIVPSFLQGNFYVWGRKIVLKPEFQFALEYRQGKLTIFQKLVSDSAESEDELQTINLANAVNTIQQRIEAFSSTPACVYISNENNRQLLIVETLDRLDEQVIEELTTRPAMLELFIQKEEIDSADLVFSDDWDQGFESIGIRNEEIASARAQLDFQSNQPVIVLQLTDQARKVLFRATRENKGRMLMVTLDDVILLLSSVNEPISNGKITIAGGRSVEQAQVLATMLPLSSQPASLVRFEGDLPETFDSGNDFGRENTKFLGLSRLELHLSIIGLLIMTSFALMIMLYAKKGLVASIMLLIGIIFSVLLVRLTGKIISIELLATFAMVLVWWIMTIIFLLQELKCLKKKGELNHNQSIERVFSIKRTFIRKPIALLLLSSMIISVLAKNYFLQSKSLSLAFAQSLSFFSLVSVTIVIFYFLAITNWSKKSSVY